jgi:hypothetical protein
MGDNFMKQGLIIFIAVGVIGSYFLISFLSKMQRTDNLSTDETRQERSDLTHYRKDVIGQTVLAFNSNESYSKKLEIWKRSPLHQEYLDLFPNFMAMKAFIDDRIVDASFKGMLLKKIDEIESDFFSGSISNMEAREKLKEL